MSSNTSTDAGCIGCLAVFALFLLSAAAVTWVIATVASSVLRG